MKSPRCLIYGIVVSLVILCLIGGALFAGYTMIPPVTKQIASTESVTVLVVTPANGSRYPSDSSIPITALARGKKSITTFELWVDGKQTQTAQVEPNKNPAFVYQTLHWLPVYSGEHQLVVRAIDEAGTTGTSNIIHITADEPAGFSLLHTVTEGEDLKALAASCSSSPEAIQAINPKLDPNAPLPVGAQVMIPCESILPIPSEPPAPPPVPIDDVPSSYPAASPDKVGPWLSGGTKAGDQTLEAPWLKVGLKDCTAQLLVEDNSTNELGFEIWRSGENNFEQIATLGVNNGASFLYEDKLQASGQVQYTVSAFNSAGKKPSNIVSLDIPTGTCGPAPIADFKMINGMLSVSSGYELVYAYASLDQGPWVRVPEGKEFAIPKGGEVDLNPLLDVVMQTNPGANQIDLEVWGWRGGVLEMIGKLSKRFDHTELTFCNLDDPMQCTGDVGSTHWVKKGEVPSNALNSTRTFKFSANTTKTNYLLVQVSTQPFPAEFQLDNPYLVDNYAIKAEQTSSTIYGKFTINFSFYNQPAAAQKATWLDPETVKVKTNLEKLFGDSPKKDSDFPDIDSEWLKNIKSNLVGSYQVDGIFDPTYYIRVIPWDYSKPVGKVSNTVTLTYKPRQDAPPFKFETTSSSIYDIKIVDFSPERKVIPDLFGCVKITAIDEKALWDYLKTNYSNPIIGDSAAKSMYDLFHNKFTSGEPVCPAVVQVEDDSVWEQLGEAFTTMWDEVVNLFNSLKNGIVDIVASAINAIIPGACDGTCKDLLMTGLNLAITYFTGIPPTLPTSEELIDDGLNYAVSLALSEAGVSCDQDCVEKWRSDIKTVADAMESSSSQPGCFSGNKTIYGKKPLCLPAALTVEPIPGGVYVPAVVTIQVIRTAPGYQYSPKDNYTLLVDTKVSTENSIGKTFWFNGPTWYPEGTGNQNQGVPQSNGTQDEPPDSSEYPGEKNSQNYGSTPTAQHVWFNYTIEEPMSGRYYLPQSVKLPDTLETGKELKIPVTLKSSRNDPSAYVYQSLLIKALTEAASKKMPEKFTQDLLFNVQQYSDYNLGAYGYSIEINAELRCYDNSAKTKIPCDKSDKLTLSAEEIQALKDNMYAATP